MSNRTDFFQSVNTQLSLPSASVSILIDGKLRQDLEPIEIVHSGWPDFSHVRLAYNTAAFTGEGLLEAENIESEFAAGRSVCINQFFNGVPPNTVAFSLPIFCGHIENIEATIANDRETVEIVARDFSSNLKRVLIYGQRIVKADGSNMFLTDLDTLFNPDSKGNANPTAIEINNQSYIAFCAEPSQNKLWSYAEVINYLLCEYMPHGQLQIPSTEQLRTLTDNQLVRDLDVTGINLIEALHRCCERIGLKFQFVPRLIPTGPNQAIVFYRAGTGRIVELNCQKTGQQLNFYETNVLSLYSRKNFWPITHKYIGQGDFKVYEATFELIKAWDATLEDIDYDKFSPSTNPNFYQVKDVYRKWCLNEAGQYSNTPYNQGQAFDFSKIFRSSNYIHHLRRFRPTLSTDKLGRSLGHFLQVSYDNGQNWWQYLSAFNILLDECGVWLSSDQLDIDTWIAALRGFLRFRITASVISDERLTSTVADGPVNSTAPVVEHLITLPRQFKYRKVSDQSIFFTVTDDTLGKPDEADDSDALYEFIRHTAVASSAVIETIDIQMPSLMFNYQVGDIVNTSPESRDLLGCRSDNRSTNRIMQVQIDFKKQCTNLKIVRERNCI